METKAINTGRQFEVDCVKFFAIFYMVFIHTYERLGAYDYMNVLPEGIFRNVLEFVAGPFGAPVFMFSMGIGMVYTHSNSAELFIKRGFKLLLTGYILNFFRGFLPILITYFFTKNPEIFSFSLQALLAVDILQFAGLAFISIGLMKKAKLSSGMMILISLLIQGVGIWGHNLSCSSNVLECLLGLFIPKGFSFFPLFLWLIYPVAGQFFGEYLQQASDKDALYKKLMLISATVVVSLSSAIIYSGNDIRLMYALYKDIFYYQNFITVVFSIPFIFIALGFSHFVYKGLEQTKFGTFICFCSKNLNTIYIIQWIVISYLAFFFSLLYGEKTAILSVSGIFITAIPVLAFSIGVTKIVVTIKQRKK